MKKYFFTITLTVLIALGAWVWVNQTFETPQAPLPDQLQIIGNIDRILIEKTKRRLTLYQDQKAVRIYQMALGFSPDGDKIKEGDGKTPEGIYKINRRNPNSNYTLSLGIDYPLAEDKERARVGGYNAGGDIFIHGQPNNLPDNLKLKGDWTAGCIALTNAEMREIWEAAPIGTEVEITP